MQANQRVEEFKRQLKTLTVKLKEAEARAEFAEKTVKKLQKEVDRLEGQLFESRQIIKFTFVTCFPKIFESIFPIFAADFYGESFEIPHNISIRQMLI